MNLDPVHVRKLVLVAVFAALGTAISQFTAFPVFGTKANPTQHLINAILGVLAGPLWAAMAAVFIGVVRNMLGTGTLYAFPGGIPGGIVVGLTYLFLRRLGRSERTRLTAALTEPLGTLLIGVPLALLFLAPSIGTQDLRNLLQTEGFLPAFLVFGFGWALSCVSGSIIGFAILSILKRMGLSRERLFGKN